MCLAFEEVGQLFQVLIAVQDPLRSRIQHLQKEWAQSTIAWCACHASQMILDLFWLLVLISHPKTNQEVLTKHGCCMACNGFMGGCHPKLQTVLPERLCELLATHKPRATETGPPVNFLEAIQSSNTPIFSPGFEDSGALWLAIHRKNVSKAASLFQKSCLLRWISCLFACSQQVSNDLRVVPKPDIYQNLWWNHVDWRSISNRWHYEGQYQKRC